MERKSRRLDGSLPRRRRGVAADELRRHNLSTVLERLHLTGPVSRSELTALTGLNRSTIADLTSELLELRLVEEGPAPATARPGRPSSLVRPRPQGAVVLAVELAVDSLAIATIGLGGHTYNRVRVARPRDRFSPEETLGDLASLAGPLLTSLPVDHHLVGIGVAVAGITRRSDGYVHQSPNLGWRDVPLADLLRQELADVPGPVLVANEADLGALAEHSRGAHVATDHLIYVSGSTGIGCGIVIDGAPMLGASGYSGEAGHTRIATGRDAKLCRCGRRGCWETEAGEIALLRAVGLPEEIGHMDEIVARAESGDQAVLAAVAHVGQWLGIGLGNLVNLFNPEAVVLGGLYDRLYEQLESSVTDALRETALDAPGRDVTLARSSLGPDAALIGASERVFARVVADPAHIHRGTKPPTPLTVEGPT